MGRVARAASVAGAGQRRTAERPHAPEPVPAGERRGDRSDGESCDGVSGHEDADPAGDREEDFEEVRMVGVVLLLLLVVARGETLLTAEIEVVEGETMYQFYEFN